MSVDSSGEQSATRKGGAGGPAPEDVPSTPDAASQPGPASAAPEVPDHLILGQVVAPFGVRGEMKVNIHTEFPERLASMDEVILAPYEYAAGDASPNRPSRRPDLRPRNRSPHGIATPKKPTPFQVETTRVHKGQMLLKVRGVDVYDTNRRHIGKIQDVLTLTANDVYVVRGPGVTDPTGELLVPAIKSVVKRVEMKRGRIVIAPIEDWT
jgi:16S rRNA processing protein RimM